jgi:hypothetical protein
MNLRLLFLSFVFLLFAGVAHAQDDPTRKGTDTAKASYDADTEAFLKELEMFIDSMDVSKPGWRDEKAGAGQEKAAALDCSKMGFMLDNAAVEWKPAITAEHAGYAAKSGSGTAITTIPGPYNYDVRYDPRTKELTSMADRDGMAYNKYTDAFEACLKLHGNDWQPTAEKGFFFSPSKQCVAGLAVNPAGEVELQVRRKSAK